MYRLIYLYNGLLSVCILTARGVVIFLNKVIQSMARKQQASNMVVGLDIGTSKIAAIIGKINRMAKLKSLA